MENRLEHLNQVNDVPVHSVLDPEFASYGRVVTGYDFSEMIAYMEQNTPIPENGNTYVASVPEMEALAVSAEVRKNSTATCPLKWATAMAAIPPGTALSITRAARSMWLSRISC